MTEPELRHLRAFLVLAEELHFGRAAKRLGIAQPALSQMIQRLERQLEFPLFVRTSRRVELTRAGAAFVAESARVVAGVSRAVDTARAVARGEHRQLRVGFLAQAAAEATGAILARFSAGRPDVTVALRALSFTDHLSALRDGAVDISLVRPPYGPDELRGIELVPLFTEPRVAVLRRDHPLADRDEVTYADLADEVFARMPAAVSPVWRAYWQVADKRGGKPPRQSREEVNTVEEKLALVASGRAISITHESVGRFYRRPTLTFVRISDIAPSTLALARPSEALADPVIDSFVQAAVDATADMRDRAALSR